MTTPETVSAGSWGQRADLAQRSLDILYATEEPQVLHNRHPADGDEQFHYWWLAHVIDVRLDAYERSGSAHWLGEAVRIADHIRTRNDGSLFNDYFDDMLWYALALHRIVQLGGPARFADDVQALWTHVTTYGWNDIGGPSLSWRVQQPGYKNTPANGPLSILGSRLVLEGKSGEQFADQALSWLEENLIAPETGFVLDGRNRTGDASIDAWPFSYNQGLYIGACVERYRRDGDESRLDAAERTALTALKELSEGGVFRREGDGEGGDPGLFKGIFFRYLDQFLQVRPVPELLKFVRSATDALWANQVVETSTGTVLRAGDDWNLPAPDRVTYSSQLSAVMALEVRARHD